MNRFFAVGGMLALIIVARCIGCSRPPASQPPASVRVQEAATAKPFVRRASGTFVDRRKANDLRVVSYNVNWDRIFPDIDRVSAAKFRRVIQALDPDILALQELRDKNAQDVAVLMDTIIPLPNGTGWQAFKGWTNIIVSKYSLKMTRESLTPSGQRGLAMALIDLPDDRFAADVYVLNNHWKCCGGTDNDPQRQQQADAIANWLRDSRTAGEELDLPTGTPVIVLGDLNLVGERQPLTTVLTGDIQDEQRYGSDAPPDWDGTSYTDAHPRHNHDGDADYTWRNDLDRWDPGRLDFILYSDSVIREVHSFVLNTTLLERDALEKTRLEPYDVTLDSAGAHFDHLPVVVDFRLVDQVRR